MGAAANHWRRWSGRCVNSRQYFFLGTVEAPNIYQTLYFEADAGGIIHCDDRQHGGHRRHRQAVLYGIILKPTARCDWPYFDCEFYQRACGYRISFQR
jgi:hypothetical protein